MNVEFNTRLPRNHQQDDTICVIIYQMTKSANFLPFNTLDLAKDYATLYPKDIVKL